MSFLGCLEYFLTGLKVLNNWRQFICLMGIAYYFNNDEDGANSILNGVMVGQQVTVILFNLKIIY